MKKLATIAAIAALAGFLIPAPKGYCDSGMADPSGGSEMEEEGSRAVTEHREKSDQMISDFNQKIEKLREQARGLSGEARAEAEKKIDLVQEKWAAATADLSGMKEEKAVAAEKAWEQVKEAAGDAVDQTRRAYTEAAVYLGLKSEQDTPDARSELAKDIANLMDDFQARIGGLRKEAGHLSGEIRKEAERMIAEAEAEWTSAMSELERIKKVGKDAGSSAWSDIKSGFNAALDALSEAYRDAADYIREKTS